MGVKRYAVFGFNNLVRFFKGFVGVTTLTDDLGVFIIQAAHF